MLVRIAGYTAALVLALTLVAACSSLPGEDTPTSSRVVSSIPAPLTGQKLFAVNCAVCHGASAEGRPDWRITKADGTLPPPPLNGDGHTWHHADGLLYRIVSRGGSILEDPRYPSFKSAMPAFGDRLSHEEIVEVLTYVKGLWEDKTSRGVPIRELQALTSEQDPFLPGGE